MCRKVVTAAGMLALFGWVGLAQADPPNSLPPEVDAPTFTLEGKGEADTDQVYFFHRRYYRRYYRPYYSYSHYRPYYSYSYYRPYYSYYPSYSYRYSYYRPSYYYSYRPYYSYSYGYHSGYGYGGFGCIDGSEADKVPATNLGQSADVLGPALNEPVPNGSYEYDGGPLSPAPLPKFDDQSAPETKPLPEIPVQGHLVAGSEQAAGGAFTFQAYGEESPAPERSGFAFPAYGEQQSSNFAVDQK